MSIVIVGSRAAKTHYPEFREPVDLDIICSREDFITFMVRLSQSTKKKVEWVKPTEKGGAAQCGPLIVDAEFLDEDDPSSRPLYETIINDPNSISDEMCGFTTYAASPNILFMMKMAHRYKKFHISVLEKFFLKTRNDIMFYRDKGCVIEDQELYDLREYHSYPYKHPALNVTKDEFFQDDGIEYVYDHDSLHEAMKVMEVPSYTRYLMDGEQVKVDRSKWDTLPRGLKIDGVYEEACVLALERAVIPHDADPDWAFRVALIKVCTSITSGWFREFAWENYDTVMYRHEVQKILGAPYNKKFVSALENNIVKPCNRITRR